MSASIDEMLPPRSVLEAHRQRTYGGNGAFHNFYNDYSHIADPNLRRRLALSEIDKVPFGKYRMCNLFGELFILLLVVLMASICCLGY